MEEVGMEETLETSAVEVVEPSMDIEECPTGDAGPEGSADVETPSFSKKKPMGSFPVFFEKHLHQVKLRQPDWSDNEIEEFLNAQWKDMSDHQKSCYVPEETEQSFGDPKIGDAIKKFNSVLNTLVHKKYPVIGLDYISVHKVGSKDESGPSYRCGLCGIIFELSSVATHVLGTKHRLGFLKTVSPIRFRQVLQIMKRKKTSKQNIVRLLIGETKRWESKLGRGEIKASKKDIPPIYSSSSPQTRSTVPLKKMRSNPRNSFSQMSPRGGLLPLNAPYQEPFYQNMPPYRSMPNYDNFHMYKKLPAMRKLRMIQELANSLISTEREARVARDILGAISKKMFQYKVQHLSPSETAALDKTIDNRDLRPLQNLQRNPPTKGRYTRRYTSEPRSSHGQPRGPPRGHPRGKGPGGRALLPNPTTYSIRNIQTSQSGSSKEDPFLIGGYSAEYKF